MNKSPHLPVLLNEVVESFKNIKSGYFVDCTLGYAGHSSEILKKFAQIKHIGIDRDIEAINFSKEKLQDYKDRSTIYKGTFAEVFPNLKEEPIVGVLADFGVSSLQLDKLERGFSFNSQVLDMRMDKDESFSAYDVVNGYSAEKLEYIFKNYGEIREHRELTNAIVEQRSIKPISSALELSKIISTVIPKYGKINSSTLAFQAIRIEVNGELSQIENLLDAIEERHFAGEIVSFITFHSLEDRLIKNRFTKWSKNCICDEMAIRCTCGNNHSMGKPLNKKPITATLEELKYNPRSRSAKLRSFCFKDV
ncbi:Ribosomal RNA small subunit methyltransferase H [Sulfurovum sp. enrichment culture clone C5]|uniref:Ribosomal RNA small subunit methyltransferase H n=1 Tax=Sulfurovum sp. enrichment culture clone C5 TaxID=497650 RepID=A0A0S4XN26_9BACT|nr:Ribosomal RNA small subunit methyltransferase H [Sulfurovum sp. enrichment culture clone C5]